MSSDAQLAADLARNPSQGLSGVYNAYSAKLYTYALTMLRDPATAQDVVHDSLLVAAGSIGQLRDPAKLRPWLYAITRNECLRAIRGRNRFSDTDEVIEVPDDSVDFYAGLRRDEASRIVAQGMAAMNPADRDILALALQHDLDVERLSQITGTKPNALHARLSRARTGLSDAISALVLHRARGKDCETLAGIIAPADQPLSPLLRKRILRHLRDCDVCERRRRGALAALRPAMAAPVFVAPPADLLSRIQHSLHQGQAAPVSAAARPFDAEGFPRPLDGRRSTAWIIAAAATVVALVLVAAGLATATNGSTTAAGDAQPITGSAPAGPVPSSSASASEAPTAASDSAAEVTPKAPVTSDEPQPEPSLPPTQARSGTKPQKSTKAAKPASTPSSKASPSKKTSPTTSAPTQPAAPQPPAQPPVIAGVTLEDLDTSADGGYTRCDAFTLRVTTTVTGEVTSVKAIIKPVGSVVSLSGSPHTGTVTLPPGDYVIAVEATGPGGTASRDAGSVLHICPG